MPRTPTPTLDELRAIDELVNGDTGAAQDEIVARLRELLPLAIADRNARKGWTDSAAMPDVTPKQIEIAPVDLVPNAIGAVLVEFDVSTEAEGIGGPFRNTITVRIYSVDRRFENEQRVRHSWARAETIRQCLYPFLGGCTDSHEQHVWKSLVPTGISIDQGDRFKNYSCTVATFQMVQSPSLTFEPV